MPATVIYMSGVVRLPDDYEPADPRVKPTIEEATCAACDCTVLAWQGHPKWLITTLHEETCPTLLDGDVLPFPPADSDEGPT